MCVPCYTELTDAAGRRQGGSGADDECAGGGSLDVAFVMSPRINSSCSEENSEAVAGGTVFPGLLPATGVELVLIDDGVAMEDLVAHQ